jgi:hypothetical protein
MTQAQRALERALPGAADALPRKQGVHGTELIARFVVARLKRAGEPPHQPVARAGAY